jgi:hypothetical protein
MPLEAYRGLLRALDRTVRKLTASAGCSGTRQPEPIQIAMHFHPAEGTTPERPPPSLSPAP